jgi:hypothetical protein
MAVFKCEAAPPSLVGLADEILILGMDMHFRRGRATAQQPFQQRHVILKVERQ